MSDDTDPAGADLDEPRGHVRVVIGVLVLSAPFVLFWLVCLAVRL